MTAGVRAATFSREKPSSRALRKMLRRPLRSGSNPTPRPRKEATSPATVTVPEVGRVTPERIRSRVLLPAPLRPMMPSDSPTGIEKLTSSKTGISRPANRGFSGNSSSRSAAVGRSWIR
jgi:hypothetical protein